MWPFRSKAPSPVAHRVFLACLALIFIAKAWFLIATPLRGLVMSPWLLDDSFITMQVAKEVALGHGFSFDGLHLTTGSSPLWTYLIATLQLLPEKDLAVRATLLFSTICGAGCAYVTYRMASKLSDSRAAATAAGVLAALMPVQFFNAMNGMETGFFSLLILLALGGATGTLRFNRLPILHALWTGIFLGVAVLTRADAVFAVAAIGLWKIWELYAYPKRREETVKEAVVIGCVLAASFVLFFVWQAIQTGSIFPDNQVGRRAIALEKHGFDPAHFQLLPYLKISAWNVFELDSLWSLATGSSLLALLAVAWAWTKERTQPLARLGTLYVGIFAAALCFYQWYFPDLHGLRYINAGSHLAILFVTLLVAELFRGRFRQLAIGVFCVVLLGSSWYRYADTLRSYSSFKDMGLFGQTNVEKQDTFWGAIDWAKSQDDSAVIALRDHGRMAYFSDRTIQDIAGILDSDVFAQRADGTLAEYLTERHVTLTFLPDPSPGAHNVYEEMHEQLRLERIVGAPNQEITGYKPYKVLGAKQ